MGKWKVNNKWHKHQILSGDPVLAPYLPQTKLFNETNVQQLLDDFSKIIIKPVKGSAGKGIIIVTEHAPQSYEVCTFNKTYTFKIREELVHYLSKKVSGSQAYLIQQYIPLLTINGRNVDFRFITQRKGLRHDWSITGKYARVAEPNVAITNFSLGSSIYTVDEALENSTLIAPPSDVLKRLDETTVSISSCLTRCFHYHLIWGCDLALDKEGNMWIIEVNSAPQTQGFLEKKALHPMAAAIEKMKKHNKKSKRSSSG
ncbi:YheC/YheD family protein [Thalassobacillus sp. CUG 92003]|uniref:YheC/YheD family protein n=1 Tax=Thalassobacillus sp. CUG 92003 TaxID=2736641 RepID=UPI0015E6BC3E